MNSGTRDRLLQSSLELFAHNGYRGASVREICNLARANPGAISYHFGGKRQLYRAVLRHAAERLFAAATVDEPSTGELANAGERLLATTSRIHRALLDHPESVRLILRDLADGGKASVEALTPSLQRAEQWLRAELDRGEHADAARAVQQTFLELAAPIFLMAGAWPVLERTLELTTADAEELLATLTRRSVRLGAFSPAPDTQPR